MPGVGEARGHGTPSCHRDPACESTCPPRKALGRAPVAPWGPRSGRCPAGCLVTLAHMHAPCTNFGHCCTASPRDHPWRSGTSQPDDADSSGPGQGPPSPSALQPGPWHARSMPRSQAVRLPPAPSLPPSPRLSPALTSLGRRSSRHLPTGGARGHRAGPFHGQPGERHANELQEGYGLRGP